MQFTVDFLRNDEYDREVSVRQVGTSRWANIYELIFEHEGKLYSTDFRRGTGDSGECPWEYEKGTDLIECPEVEPYEVKVTKYRVKQ